MALSDSEKKTCAVVIDEIQSAYRITQTIAGLEDGMMRIAAKDVSDRLIDAIFNLNLLVEGRNLADIRVGEFREKGVKDANREKT